MLITWGRALIKLGGYCILPTLGKLRIQVSTNLDRQTLGAKIQGQEGNSPQCTLRSPNLI